MLPYETDLIYTFIEGWLLGLKTMGATTSVPYEFSYKGTNGNLYDCKIATSVNKETKAKFDDTCEFHIWHRDTFITEHGQYDIHDLVQFVLSETNKRLTS